jgi:thiamine kinase
MPPAQLLSAVAKALPDLSGDWLPLAGGRTNRVWRVGDVVVKFYDPSAATPLFPNDQMAEVAALRHFSTLKLSPALKAFGQGWLAYGHVPGRAWHCDVLPVATILGRLHQSPPPPTAFRNLSTGSEALREQTQALLAQCGMAGPLPETLRIAPIAPRPIHGDAVAGNIISGPMGLCLIDWQCPALGDPTEDLAAFLSPAMQLIYRGKPLDPAQETAFLRAYPDPEIVARYRALKPLYHLRMLAHCHWRAKRGDAGFALAAKAEQAALERGADPDPDRH